LNRLTLERDMAVLVVEHSMEEVCAIADRLVVLDAGRLVLDGAPRDVLEHVQELKQIGVRPPDATLMGIAAQRAGLIGATDGVMITDADFVQGVRHG
jgi:ABC-type multidrug transport system ATPase subunit